jgi:MarR family transcriptional regulator, transcriptional regulator for hemolysin
MSNENRAKINVNGDAIALGKRSISAKSGSTQSKRSLAAFAERSEQAADELGLRGALTYTREQAIGAKIAVIARELSKQFGQVVERDGLTHTKWNTRAKWRTILAVARNPGATQRSIAATLDITEVSASQMIIRLCEDGYLERREHPKDRRAYSLHLTPATQPLLARLGELGKSWETKTFAGFTEANLSQLDALLDMIASNLAVPTRRYVHERSSANTAELQEIVARSRDGAEGADAFHGKRRVQLTGR